MVSVKVTLVAFILFSAFSIISGAPRSRDHARQIFKETSALANDMKKASIRNVFRTVGYLSEGVGHIVHRAGTGIGHMGKKTSDNGRKAIESGKKLKQRSKKLKIDETDGINAVDNARVTHSNSVHDEHLKPAKEPIHREDIQVDRVV